MKPCMSVELMYEWDNSQVKQEQDDVEPSH